MFICVFTRFVFGADVLMIVQVFFFFYFAMSQGQSMTDIPPEVLMECAHLVTVNAFFQLLEF
jgi:hypothetical protein